MVRHALAVSIALGMLRGPGCGDVSSPESGPNAPCTRDGDCKSGLVCAQGVCSEPEAGAPDAGEDG